MINRRAKKHHIVWRKRLAVAIPIFLIGTVSCTAPKIMVQQFVHDEKGKVELSAFEHMILPPLDYEGWDTYAAAMGKSIPPVVRRTQMGMEFSDDTSKTYFCRPSAFPHFTIDTSYSIKEKEALLGGWKKIGAGLIEITDTIHGSDSSVTRKDSVSSWGNEDDDVMVVVDDKRYKLYARLVGKANFKRQLSKKYELVNGRFLLLYTFTLSDAATNFTGISPDGHLIVDNYGVEETRKKNGDYIYKTSCLRMVFKKIL